MEWFASFLALCRRWWCSTTTQVTFLHSSHTKPILTQLAVLSLSAVASASDAVILFENETAQLLCRQMNGIARPLLTDVNRLIAANLLPIFIPKLTLRHSVSYWSKSISNSSICSQLDIFLMNTYSVSRFATSCVFLWRAARRHPTVVQPPVLSIPGHKTHATNRQRRRAAHLRLLQHTLQDAGCHAGEASVISYWILFPVTLTCCISQC